MTIVCCSAKTFYTQGAQSVNRRLSRRELYISLFTSRLTGQSAQTVCSRRTFPDIKRYFAFNFFLLIVSRSSEGFSVRSERSLHWDLVGSLPTEPWPRRKLTAAKRYGKAEQICEGRNKTNGPSFFLTECWGAWGSRILVWRVRLCSPEWRCFDIVRSASAV